MIYKFEVEGLDKPRYCSGVVRVGLTGGIGSGKSTAGDFFASQGAIVTDSDQLSRQAIERGSEGFNSVVSHFGEEILNNGDIDRQKLAEIIFADASEREYLESIIHPYVARKYQEIVDHAPVNSLVINQIPLLVEINGASRFDLTITVNSETELRVNRLLIRGLSHSQITSRMNSQVSDERRAEYCDIVVENNGSREDFIEKLHRIWEEILIPFARQEISRDEIIARKKR